MHTENSVYRVLAIQVPMFWEAIKFACVHADEVPEADRPNYFDRLLQDLLSDKAQCWVVLDTERILHSLIISRITLDPISNKKVVDIQCMYSIKKQSDEVWRKLFQLGIDFAKQQECSDVIFKSGNPKIWEKAKIYGCREMYRVFSFGLGG